MEQVDAAKINNHRQEEKEELESISTVQNDLIRDCNIGPLLSCDIRKSPLEPALRFLCLSRIFGFSLKEVENEGIPKASIFAPDKRAYIYSIIKGLFIIIGIT